MGRLDDRAVARARDGIARRVAAFARSHDPAVVLDEEATREINLLYQAIRSPTPEVMPTMSNLAWLRWYRAVASPPGTDRDDLDSAIAIFSILNDEPGIDIPSPLRPLLDHWMDLEGGTISLAKRAVRMMRTADRAESPIAVLAHAADLLELVVAVSSDDDPNLPIALNNLAAVHDLRYERSNEVADLDAAIAAIKRAAAAMPDVDKVRLLSIAGQRLYVRFQRGGTKNDLTAAIEVLEQARSFAMRGSPEWRNVVSNLSAAYGTRFTVAGSDVDLDLAVELSRSALDPPTGEPSTHPRHLSNYAVVLLSRYERTGALGDLDTAIDLLRSVVDNAPQDDADRGMYLTNLGIALKIRAANSSAGLDDAVETGLAAVAATSDGDLDKPGRHSNLALTLATRFERGRSADDLRAAIEHSRLALKSAPPGHPKRGLYMSNFASLLLTQWKESQTEDDLELAVLAGRAALAETPPDFPARAKVAMQLANALMDQATSSQLKVDLHEATAAFRDAARCATAAVSDRVRAARLWADMSVLVDRESAEPGTARAPIFDGYELAVSLLPLLTWPGTDRASRERHLRGQVGLATNAAAAALAADQPDRAVIWLEHGRAVLWSRTLEANVDLDAVRSVDPHLAADLDRVRQELNRLGEPFPPSSTATDLAARLG